MFQCQNSIGTYSCDCIAGYRRGFKASSIKVLDMVSSPLVKLMKRVKTSMSANRIQFVQLTKLVLMQLEAIAVNHANLVGYILIRLYSEFQMVGLGMVRNSMVLQLFHHLGIRSVILMHLHMTEIW